MPSTPPPADAILIEVLGEPLVPGNTATADPATRLSLDALRAFTNVPAAGGIAFFVGTTRDTHGGRPVARLVYDGHPRLMKTVSQAICLEAFQRAGGYSESTRACSDSGGSSSSSSGGLTRLAVAYRLGEVPVGEASVIVAAAAPHRREAFLACEYVIDELKARVPMWKQEWYADEEEGTGAAGGVWKENCECGWRSKARTALEASSKHAGASHATGCGSACAAETCAVGPSPGAAE